MRSWHSAILAIVIGACGTDVDPGAAPNPACETSILTYANFGAPFMLDWCRGCHSSTVPDGMRQGAPLGVDFDDLDRVRAFSTPIEARAASTAPNMPPASGPSEDERTLLAEWISCGAK